MIPEASARFVEGINSFAGQCIAKEFKYPLVLTVTSAAGYVLLLRYAEGEPHPVQLFEQHPAEADLTAPAWATLLDANGRWGHYTFFDLKPVEELKLKLFSPRC